MAARAGRRLDPVPTARGGAGLPNGAGGDLERPLPRPCELCVGAVWESGGLLRCTITDDGVGFDPEAVHERPEAGLHLGLAALAERLRLARGVIDVGSAPGVGTEIRFAVPVGPGSPLVREHAAPASPMFP